MVARLGLRSSRGQNLILCMDRLLLTAMPELDPGMGY